MCTCNAVTNTRSCAELRVHILEFLFAKYPQIVFSHVYGTVIDGTVQV